MERHEGPFRKVVHVPGLRYAITQFGGTGSYDLAPAFGFGLAEDGRWVLLEIDISTDDNGDVLGESPFLRTVDGYVLWAGTEEPDRTYLTRRAQETAKAVRARQEH